MMKAAHAVSASLVLLGLALSGCSALAYSVSESGQPGSVGQSESRGPVASGVVVSPGPGWSSAGVEGRIPAPGACHTWVGAAGGELPDPACTPGAVDARITQANVDATLGRPGGYTASVRPPEAMTRTVKAKLMAAYGIPRSQAAHYELDHKIPLCLGGSSDVANLWPQKNVFIPHVGRESSMVHNSKDEVEAVLCDAVKQHKYTLAEAQEIVATDWTAFAVAAFAPTGGDD